MGVYRGLTRERRDLKESRARWMSELFALVNYERFGLHLIHLKLRIEKVHLSGTQRSRQNQRNVSAEAPLHVILVQSATTLRRLLCLCHHHTNTTDLFVGKASYLFGYGC